MSDHTLEPATLPHTLPWSDALRLDMPVMDEVHEEFVALLARVVQADDEDLLPRWSALIAHTREHFGMEDRWMRDTGFAAGNCHTTQHKVVLQVMQEGEARGHAGDLGVVRQMADELGTWFVQHAQSMDAALALHMRSAGYSPA
jgi:hemerythrin-like metal-binding protein